MAGPNAVNVPPAGHIKATWRELAATWALVAAGIATICFSIYFYRSFLTGLPPVPSEAGKSQQEVFSALDAHKLVLDQYRENASFAFDLVVTKTFLPLVTLLLGYLFGKL